MKHKSSLLFLAVLLLMSCNQTNDKTIRHEEKAHANLDNEHNHWTYVGETGPEHWSEIEKQSDCDGKRQSPINILDIDVVEDASLKPIETHYSSHVKIHEVTNNGHSIQYNFEKGDFISLEGNDYELKQIHFHEPSEHTINGIRYPLEMHLVHANKDNKIAVIAVMAKEGESSEAFTFLENYLPIYNGDTKQIDKDFDINLNLPKNKTYYSYGGSLTTPPCTEDVSWFVFKDPITVSLEQVMELQKLMPVNNYRNTQPINGRIVHQSSTQIGKM
ncbi:carbonic anhydrase [Winogradskyella endarachnes]|uniref:Carbonic anhydrase n=1 Tax=Winogradskyella endarachnes TaxID=2681965 RepID=A0A6L6U6G9_9FLAO|nr:carbonic anhydrase family protein [Winogradskyella endarachnes]MUU77126.1 carbonic anhydrase family protein [Winogradskyella endarachnes]